MNVSADLTTNRFGFVAGRFCLDYANTADWHESTQPIELLTSYGDLLAWGREAGILDPADALDLERLAERTPETAVAVYRRAIILREVLFRIFRAVAHGERAADADLALLNQEVARAGRQAAVVATPDGYGWSWTSRQALDRVLWEVARSAADLLTSDDLGRVRQCAGDPCGWLFYDTSRNHSRRWCDMESCGNRAKARRHYARQRRQLQAR